MSSYREILEKSQRELQEAGIENADIDAKLLLSEAYSLTFSDYILCLDREMEEDERFEVYATYIEKRKSHIPLQYILGKQNFYGIDFYVDENVLIPRADTENMVELILHHHKHTDISILDLCTGSGCIGITLKKLGGYQEVVLADISQAALEVARENASRLEAEVTIIETDMFQNIRGKYDIIVSNPPYIRTGDIDGLMSEVRDFEPHLALDGDEDGLKFYRNLKDNMAVYLKEDGILYMEIGYDQAQDVREIFAGHRVEVFPDLNGLDRVVKVSRL